LKIYNSEERCRSINKEEKGTLLLTEKMFCGKDKKEIGELLGKGQTGHLWGGGGHFFIR
jgi:hypothetical protein